MSYAPADFQIPTYTVVDNGQEKKVRALDSEGHVAPELFNAMLVMIDQVLTPNSSDGALIVDALHELLGELGQGLSAVSGAAGQPSETNSATIDTSLLKDSSNSSSLNPCFEFGATRTPSPSVTQAGTSITYELPPPARDETGKNPYIEYFKKNPVTSVSPYPDLVNRPPVWKTADETFVPQPFAPAPPKKQPTARPRPRVTASSKPTRKATTMSLYTPTGSMHHQYQQSPHAPSGGTQTGSYYRESASSSSRAPSTTLVRRGSENIDLSFLQPSSSSIQRRDSYSKIDPQLPQMSSGGKRRASENLDPQVLSRPIKRTRSRSIYE